MREKGKCLLLIYVASLLLVSTAAVSVRAATPNVYVNPSVMIDNTKVPGQHITITLMIADVTDCWAYRVDLGWGAPILDCVDDPGTTMDVEGVNQGSFLPPGETIYVEELDQAKGTLSVACTLTQGHEWKSGGGILFTVEFTVEQVGATTLDIYFSRIQVKGPPPYYLPTPIDHTSQDGFFSNVLVANYDTAVTSVTTSKTIICQGYSAKVNVTVQNQGNVTLGFSVTAYYNSTPIEFDPPALSPGASITITFTLSTTGLDKGVYTISGYAWPVPGETDTGDNIFIFGTIRVNMVGDLNGDGKVTITDIVIIALTFGSRPGDPNWNPNTDINGDRKVTITDIVIAALHFGEVDP